MILRTDPANNAPSKVRSLSASTLANVDVRVQWSAAEEHASCAVDGHTVAKWSISGDRGSVTIANVLQYDWPASGILPNDTYVFSVTANCGQNAGERTDADPYQSATGANLPPTPDFSVPLPSATQVELTWSTTDDPSEKGWTFEVQRRSAAVWAAVSGTYGERIEYLNGGFRTVFYDRSVQPDTFYSYRVFTIDSGSSHPKSLVSRIRTARTPLLTTAGSPGPPRHVTATNGVGLIQVTWNAPSDTGDSAITGYQIIRDGQVLVADNGVTTSYDDTSVVAGSKYSYRVRAINTQGTGQRSLNTAGSTRQYSTTPAPGITEHTRPDRSGETVKVELKNDIVNENAEIRVSWSDGTAGSRTCHTDYVLVYGRNGVFERPASLSSGNPFLDEHFSALPSIVSLATGIGPYNRYYSTTVGFMLSDTDPAPKGFTYNNLSIRVYCGDPRSSDSAKVGQDDIAIVTTFTISS
jgi:hypothetical protein